MCPLKETLPISVEMELESEKANYKPLTRTEEITQATTFITSPAG